MKVKIDYNTDIKDLLEIIKYKIFHKLTRSADESDAEKSILKAHLIAIGNVGVGGSSHGSATFGDFFAEVNLYDGTINLYKKVA